MGHPSAQGLSYGTPDTTEAEWVAERQPVEQPHRKCPSPPGRLPNHRAFSAQAGSISAVCRLHVGNKDRRVTKSFVKRMSETDLE
jgi:hypothetical protein